MKENQGLELLDYLIIVIKFKVLFIVLGISLIALSYAAIYFLIDEQYDASALIIPAEQESLGGFASILNDFSSLPIGKIAGFGEGMSTDIYNTVIFSRTNLENMIERYDLHREYGRNRMDQTIEQLSSNITTELTDEGAFMLTIRASSPEKAAEMTNWLVDEVNRKVIELNTQKAKQNRMFLGTRYDEVTSNLREAEEAMKEFQKRTGVYEVTEQVAATMKALIEMEAELAKYKVQKDVMKQVAGENSPLFTDANTSYIEYKKEFDKMKNRQGGSDVLIPVESIPENGITYLRLYRDIEIYSSMLEFIIPMYEQAKFEEQKDMPILQIIDHAKPPEVKSYPRRGVFSVLITIAILAIIFIYLIMREVFERSENPKVQFIRRNLFKFSSPRNMN